MLRQRPLLAQFRFAFSKMSLAPFFTIDEALQLVLTENDDRFLAQATGGQAAAAGESDSSESDSESDERSADQPADANPLEVSHFLC